MMTSNEITTEPSSPSTTQPAASTESTTVHGSSITHRKKTTIEEPVRPFTDRPVTQRTISTRSRPSPSRITTLLQPRRPVGPAPKFLASMLAIVKASWLNILLVFIPVSWALHFALKDDNENKDTIVFVTSFLAIIPLAKLLAFATDELSMRVGQTLAGLLNATLGNAVELIVSIIALIKCELRLVQASLVGSILSNLLLVLGMCFFAGGLKYSEQGFGASASQLNSSLLTISVIAVLLPAAFHLSFPEGDPNEGTDILALSRGCAIILLFIYGGYLVFQLYSHASLYEDHSAHIIKSTQYAGGQTPFQPSKLMKFGRNSNKEANQLLRTKSPVSISTTNGTTSDVENGMPLVAEEEEKEEEEETPQMNLWTTIGLLVAVTVLVAVTAEWLVGSIHGLTDRGGIREEFVGIILLPIVGNAAEHVTAVTVSVKDKLMLSLGVAVGSSIQIALFVIPFMVILAWILGKPLTLLFDPYESITLFLAVLTVNYVVQDGKSNWLEGFILMCLYVILGLTFWFYPGSDPSGLLAQCVI